MKKEVSEFAKANRTPRFDADSRWGPEGEKQGEGDNFQLFLNQLHSKSAEWKKFVKIIGDEQKLSSTQLIQKFIKPN